MDEPTKHSNIQDALNSWKAELLDLTGRNQLLYLKNYKSQIELDNLKFFNIKKFFEEVDQKLIDSEIEVDIMDYFEEPNNDEKIPEEDAIPQDTESEEEYLKLENDFNSEETLAVEESIIEDETVILENQVNEEKVEDQPIQEEKEEIVKEVEPLGENPTPEEIAEFIKKIKDQNDNWSRNPSRKIW